MTTFRIALAPCAAIAVLTLQAFSSRAHAQALYKWTDADGTVHMSDLPPPQQSEAKTPAAPVNKALKRLELPYQGLEGRARRVIVQVRFNDRVTAPMALDTGAPGMVLSVNLAEKLDLFSRDQGKLLVSARGLGGEAPAIRTILDSVTIGGVVERFVPVTVTTSLSEVFEGLVGMDFMSQYSMTIDPGRKVVVLQEQPSTAEAPGGHPEAWWRDNFAEFRSLRDAWRQYQQGIEKELSDSQLSAGTTREELLERRALANFQSQEAEKLYARLDRYASTQSVPRHWR